MLVNLKTESLQKMEMNEIKGVDGAAEIKTREHPPSGEPVVLEVSLGQIKVSGWIVWGGQWWGRYLREFKPGALNVLNKVGQRNKITLESMGLGKSMQLMFGKWGKRMSRKPTEGVEEGADQSLSP